MMGPTHRLFGAACGASVAVAGGQSEAMVATTALIATVTAHGPTSPDLDQTRPWVMLRQALPVAGRYLNHRTGVTHWWFLPVAAWLLVELLVPLEARWVATALIIGWSSHLVGDAIFGSIPLWPRGPMVGLGLRTDGFLESGKIFRHRLLPISPLQLVLLGWLGWIANGLMPATLQQPTYEVITQLMS